MERDALALRKVEELVAQGEALLEARRNPARGGTMFPDFSQAYRRWYVAGKQLVQGFSGQDAANEWTAGWIRAMQTLDQLVPYCLKEQERQQGMLLELQERLRANAGSGAGREASGGAAAIPGRGYALKPDTRDFTDEQLLEELRTAAKTLGKATITRAEYQMQRRFSPDAFASRFGSWNNALTAAGLPLSSRRGIPTLDLFENLARVWEAVGRQPVWSDMRRPQSEYSVAPYLARFGGWRSALKAFIAWAGKGKMPEKGPATQHRALPEMARQPNLRLRFTVLHRDSFKCTACGRSPANEPGVKLHVDHKNPWSRSRLTTLDNLTTLCEKCNLGKGDRVVRRTGEEEKR